MATRGTEVRNTKRGRGVGFVLNHARTAVVPGIIFVTGLVAGELNVGVLSVGLDFRVDSEGKE